MLIFPEQFRHPAVYWSWLSVGDCDHDGDGDQMVWLGKKAEREERNLINRFQPISLCAQIIPSLDRDNTSHVICVTWDSPV